MCKIKEHKVIVSFEKENMEDKLNIKLLGTTPELMSALGVLMASIAEQTRIPLELLVSELLLANEEFAEITRKGKAKEYPN